MVAGENSFWIGLGDCNSDCPLALYSFRLVVFTLDECASDGIRTRRSEGHGIGVVIGSALGNHAGTGQGAGRRAGEEMVLICIIDPFHSVSRFDGDSLWVKAIDIMPTDLFSDRDGGHGV